MKSFMQIKRMTLFFLIVEAAAMLQQPNSPVSTLWQASGKDMMFSQIVWVANLDMHVQLPFPLPHICKGMGKWHVDRVIPDWVIPHWWRQLAAHQLLADQIPSYWKNNPQDIAASCKEVANILMEQGTLPKVQLKGICQWQLAGASTNCIFFWAFVRTGTLILDHPRVVDSGVVVTSLYNVLEDSNCRNR